MMMVSISAHTLKGRRLTAIGNDLESDTASPKTHAEEISQPEGGMGSTWDGVDQESWEGDECDPCRLTEPACASVSPI